MWERQTLEAIAEILRRARLSRTVRVVEERTIIVLESKRRSKARDSHRTNRASVEHELLAPATRLP